MPNTSSEYAKEGTLAHNICEIILLNRHLGLSTREYNKRLKKYMSSEYYTEEMWDYCNDYADYVTAQMSAGAELFVEYKLDMSSYVPEGFGTADALVINHNVLKFTDLKYGKGVPVHAPNNPQLMIYALGALNDLGFIYGVERVEMTI